MGLAVGLFERVSPRFHVTGIYTSEWLNRHSWRVKMSRKNKRLRLMHAIRPLFKDALHWAAEYGQDDILKYLIKSGADPEVCMWEYRETALDYGATAVHLAAANGHASTVRLLLLDEKVSPRSRSYDVLEVAARYGRDEVVRVILHCIKRKVYRPYNSSHAVELAAKHGHTSTMRLLAAAGEPLNNTHTWKHFTASLYAASMGDKETLEVLIEYGANARIPLSKGECPLDLALANGHEDVARLLIEHYKPHLPKLHATTASLAACHGHESCVRIAMELGAPLEGEAHQYDGQGDSKAQWLIKREDNHKALGNGYLPALHEAAGNGHSSIVSLLLESGESPNSRLKYGFVPLHYAACSYPPDKKAVSVAKVLVEAGAKLDVKGYSDCMPLHLAAKKGNNRLVEYLISQGATVDVKDFFSTTPLHLAAANTRCQIMAILLGAGAAIDAQGCTGMTPLHYAACNKNMEAYSFLVCRGADQTIQNKKGRTALEERESRVPYFSLPERLVPAYRPQPPPREIKKGDYPFCEILDPLKDFDSGAP